MIDDLSKRVRQTVERQLGVVFAEPALVGRAMYTGRDIIAKNSRFAPGYQDERGYVPVEWWIMSMTAAGNDLPKPGEGVTRLILDDGDRVPLDQAAAAAGDVLFAEYLAGWPLTKVLDIGGEPVVPDFGPFRRRARAEGEAGPADQSRSACSTFRPMSSAWAEVSPTAASNDREWLVSTHTPTPFSFMSPT